MRAIAKALQRADDATVEAHWAALDSPLMVPRHYDDEMGKQFAMDGYRKTVQVFVNAAASSQGVVFAIM